MSRQRLAISWEGSDLIIILVEEGGYEVPFGVERVGWELAGGEEAGAPEHHVAEMPKDAGLACGDGAVGDGGGKFVEQAMGFCVRDRGAGGGGEFTGEIGGSKAAVRGVGMRVAKAVVLRMSREGAAASIGKLKPATSVWGFGAFGIHVGRVTRCVYSCLVTERCMQFRTAGGSVRMA